MDPIWANWKRFIGLHLTVPPTSISRVGLFRTGSIAPRPGLSIPGMRPRRITPPAAIAPVLPDDTIPAASPDRTISNPMTRLEFFFLLMEIEGESPPFITSFAGTMLSLERTFFSAFSIIGLIFSLSPISATERCGWSRQARMAALHGSSGAWSPPIASSAISIFSPPFKLAPLNSWRLQQIFRQILPCRRPVYAH